MQEFYTLLDKVIDDRDLRMGEVSMERDKVWLQSY